MESKQSAQMGGFMMSSGNVIEIIECDECGQTIGTGDEYIAISTGEVFDCEDCFVDYCWQWLNAEQCVLRKED